MTLLDDFLGKKNTFSPKLNEPQTRPPVNEDEEEPYISPKRLREMTSKSSPTPTLMSPPVCVLCGRRVEILEDDRGYCNHCNRMWAKFGVIIIHGRRIDVMY